MRILLLAMFKLQNSFLNLPILSLRNGAQIALTTGFVINPNNLKVDAFFCKQPKKNSPELILLAQDIRDFMPRGIAVNDDSALSDPEDLVRLKDFIKLRFEPIGKKVVTMSGDNIGKVSDYAIDEQSFYIQKLYTSKSIIMNLAGGSLSIDRSQINEITDKKIIIKDLLDSIPASTPAIA